jgi:hypothetical protein
VIAVLLWMFSASAGHISAGVRGMRRVFVGFVASLLLVALGRRVLTRRFAGISFTHTPRATRADLRYSPDEIRAVDGIR